MHLSVKFQLQCFSVLSGVAGSTSLGNTISGGHVKALGFRPLQQMTRKAGLNAAKHSQFEE